MTRHSGVRRRCRRPVMARTHGTRSAYNAGCRCEACREASQLARARQREAERCQLGSPVNEDAVASSDGRAVAWVIVALVCFGTGVCALEGCDTSKP